MFEKLGLTRMAQALAAHSGTRLSVIASNVANADTPGFRAGDIAEFSTAYREVGAPLRSTRPGHFTEPQGRAVRILQVGDGMAPNGNDVSLDIQMMKAVEARQSQEMALAVYRTGSSILRASLGRN